MKSDAFRSFFVTVAVIGVICSKHSSLALDLIAPGQNDDRTYATYHSSSFNPGQVRDGPETQSYSEVDDSYQVAHRQSRNGHLISAANQQPFDDSEPTAKTYEHSEKNFQTALRIQSALDFNPPNADGSYKFIPNRGVPATNQQQLLDDNEPTAKTYEHSEKNYQTVLKIQSAIAYETPKISYKDEDKFSSGGALPLLAQRAQVHQEEQQEEQEQRKPTNTYLAPETPRPVYNDPFTSVVGEPVVAYNIPSGDSLASYEPLKSVPAAVYTSSETPQQEYENPSPAIPANQPAYTTSSNFNPIKAELKYYTSYISSGSSSEYNQDAPQALYQAPSTTQPPPAYIPPATTPAPLYGPPEEVYTEPPPPRYIPPARVSTEPPPPLYIPPARVSTEPPPPLYIPPVRTTQPPPRYIPPRTNPPALYIPPSTQPPPRYVPPRTTPPPLYAPPSTQPPPRYIPPRTTPPPLYAPPSTQPPPRYIPPQTTQPPPRYIPPQTTQPPPRYIPPQATQPPPRYIPPRTTPPALYIPPQTTPAALYLPPQTTPAPAYLPPLDTSDDLYRAPFPQAYAISPANSYNARVLQPGSAQVSYVIPFERGQTRLLSSADGLQIRNDIRDSLLRSTGNGFNGFSYYESRGSPGYFKRETSNRV